MVDLHVDAAEVGETDEEIVLRVIVVFGDCESFERGHQAVAQCLFVAAYNNIGDVRIHLAKLFSVGRLHFGRQDIFAHFLRHRVLYIQNIVDFIDQIRRDRKREQAALFKRRLDGVVEILARGEKFVVPNRDIAAEVVLMDQPHQLLRVTSVLLAVAKENVCVKGGSDLFCQLVADNNRIQILRQLLLIRDRRRVGVVLVEVLQIAEFLIKNIVKSAFLHERQNGDAVLKRERNINIHRTVFLCQQLGGDGYDKQLHFF